MQETPIIGDKINRTEINPLEITHDVVRLLQDFLLHNPISRPLLSVASVSENWFKVSAKNRAKIEQMYGQVVFKIFDPSDPEFSAGALHVEGQIGVGLFQEGQNTPFCWAGVEVCRYGLGRKPRYGLKIRQFQAKSEVAPQGVKSISAINWANFLTKMTEDFLTEINQSGLLGLDQLSFVGIGLSQYIYSSQGSKFKHLQVAQERSYRPMSGITWEEIESLMKSKYSTISQAVASIQFIKDVL